ncbi:hypothetical protein FGB62_339g04 [Gracilaria domingensis]|nr:hypothetical protein FGB62_339g04 [Gracilaria domingensis]
MESGAGNAELASFAQGNVQPVDSSLYSDIAKTASLWSLASDSLFCATVECVSRRPLGNRDRFLWRMQANLTTSPPPKVRPKEVEASMDHTASTQLERRPTPEDFIRGRSMAKKNAAEWLGTHAQRASDHPQSSWPQNPLTFVNDSCRLQEMRLPRCGTGLTLVRLVHLSDFI